MGGRLFASHVRAGAAGAAEPSFVTPGHGNRPLPGLRGLVLESGGQRPPGDDDAIYSYTVYIWPWRRSTIIRITKLLPARARLFDF